MVRTPKTLAVMMMGCLLLTSGAAVAGWQTSFTDQGATFTDPTDYYYPTVVKQGGTYHMWMQAHGGLDDVWYTSSADGKTGWSAPVQCLVGGSAIAGWNTHPSVVDTGTNFRLYANWSGPRGIDVAEAPYGDPTNWTQLGSDVITRGAGGEFHQDSASVHTIAQWYDVHVYQYGGQYEAFIASDFGLHYGVSANGITGWTAVNSVTNTSPPPPDTTGPPVFQKGAAGEWDSYTMGKPTVIRLADDEYCMWYGSGKLGDPKAYAAGIGYATSTDGVNWTRDPGNPLFHVTDGTAYRDKRTYTPWVMLDGSEARMYFSAEAATGGADSIGLATAPVGGGPPPEPTSIPEPGALSLLALLGLGGMWRRRRRG